MLAAVGVNFPSPKQVVRAGVEVQDHPRVVIDPPFGVTLAQWRAKLPTPNKIKIAPGSTLILQGDLRGLLIESLELKAC